jgi:ABC-2 type transport system permease protein
VIVNLDQGRLPAGSQGNFEDLELTMPGGVEGADLATAASFGDLLASLLQAEVFADFMSVSEAIDKRAGRAAVDDQEAGVAIIIPANFSEAMIQGEGVADVILYQDPTLSFGPMIVESIVRQVLDNFAANTIAMSITINGLLESGVALDQALVGDIVERTTAAQSGAQGDGAARLVETRLPPGIEEASNIVTEIVSLILGGMMIFFVFFTAAASIETILTEEERGTLQRLFTTPTSHRTILNGKALAGIITVTIQIIVLMMFGHFIFGVDWGSLIPVVLVVAGIALAAAATGLFLVSLMQNTRQGGIMFGGVLTVTGMIALIPVFTAGNPSQPESLQIVPLLVPQGWAMRGLTVAQEGGTIADILPVFAGLLAWTLVLGFIGQRRLQKRFA